MQDPLFCATCVAPLVFTVPELSDNRWYAGCIACGKKTSLEAIPNQGKEDLATFRTTGVFSRSTQR